MNILAIDTATGSCSAAVSIGGKIVAKQFDPAAGAQSRVLMPLIERTLKEAGLEYKDLGQVISTVGPGSFTGLRIGLSAARAVAFAAGIPVRGITTLSALAIEAAKHSPKNEILCVLNAGKGEVYFQWFKSDASPITQPEVGKIEVAAARGKSDFTAVGNVTEQLSNVAQAHIISEINYPLAEYFVNAPQSSLIDAYPFYIRAPDAKLPKSATA